MKTIHNVTVTPRRAAAALIIQKLDEISFSLEGIEGLDSDKVEDVYLLAESMIEVFYTKIEGIAKGVTCKDIDSICARGGFSL